jgi:hypothetical protein
MTAHCHDSIPTPKETKRLFGLLAASALLHLLVMTLVVLPAPDPTPANAPLEIQLRHSEVSPEPTRSVPTSGPDSIHPRRPLPHQEPARIELAVPVATPEATKPTIDLDAARATVRQYAREPVRHLPYEPQMKLLTVEAAVAKATEPDIIAEKRGPAGEYVTEGKHFRCIQPLVKPHYLEGMNPPPLCQRR